jgi:hypothetical protein
VSRGTVAKRNACDGRIRKDAVEYCGFPHIDTSVRLARRLQSRMLVNHHARRGDRRIAVSAVHD